MSAHPELVEGASPRPTVRGMVTVVDEAESGTWYSVSPSNGESMVMVVGLVVFREYGDGGRLGGI